MGIFIESSQLSGGKMEHSVEGAFETFIAAMDGPFLFSVEHASNRIPIPLTTIPDDLPWLSTHWALDIGCHELVRQLTLETSSCAVMARFSRLVCDPNRHRNRHDFVVARVNGYSLSFNKHIDELEVIRRIADYYDPFHNAFDSLITRRKTHSHPFALISVHSFTPVWKHKLRTMDIGLLYDQCAPLANDLGDALRKQGFYVAYNEPYSGRFGLMYSVERQGEKHQIPYLELEFNQAILCTQKRITDVARRVCAALAEINVGNSRYRFKSSR